MLESSCVVVNFCNGLYEFQKKKHWFQAGQVWYPDSAFKTAEVIGDFNREGLPLLFIASLRGFSGGQRGRQINPYLVFFKDIFPKQQTNIDLIKHYFVNFFY